MLGNEPRNFPMSDGGVLADGLFHTASVCRKRGFGFAKERQSFNIAVAKGAHGLGTEMRIGGDMADRMCTGISVNGSIRQSTGTDGIQNDQKYAFHRFSFLFGHSCHSPYLL